MKKDTILIKIGGAMAGQENMILALASDMKKIAENYSFIIVHGGGAEVSALSRHFGIEPKFVNGIRMTSSEEMKYVDQMLSGLINKRLVRLFYQEGFNAVGLTGSDGGCFIGEAIGLQGSETNHTGKVRRVNPELLNRLLEDGFLPLLASTSMDEKGRPLNINADEAAFPIAMSLRAKSLVFLSDIPGILKDNQVLKTLSVSQAESEIQSGVIQGGMIPKVKSSIEALSGGVGEIIIGQFLKAGDLNSLIAGDAGSRIIQ
ncbi:MAG: acetylglutamate kinase [Spirochaetales bacterium]|nr:acetylglutamate kinase [Spirochaetales bacterium]